MTNYGCLSVGINHYIHRGIEPLQYAEADAQGLVQFLVEVMHVPQDICMLLTGTAIGKPQGYPTYEGIMTVLESLSRPSNDQGWLWLFWSGQGVHWAGEDYLLTVDSDLRDIPNTAISARSLMASVQRRRALVLLDINRSPGLGLGGPVGRRFSDLARQMGVNLCQSVSGDEYSYERAELNHGLFATALEEAMSYHRDDLSLANLQHYLGDRLPELSNHYYTPRQTPNIYFADGTDLQESIIPGRPPAPEVQVLPPLRYRSGQGNTTKIQAETTKIQLKTAIQPDSPSPLKKQPPMAEPPRRPESKPALLPWLGGAVLLLLAMIAGVWLRNMDAFTGGGGQPIASPPVNPPSPQDNSTTSRPVNSSPTAPPANPSPVAPASPLGSPANLGSNPPASPAAPPANLNSTPVAVSPGNSQINPQGQVILENARGLLQSDRATQFSEAIKIASQVPPNDPLYPQAQADIARWSVVIMDMAHGRAKQGDWSGAIAAAQQIPPSSHSAYQDSQFWISRWQELVKQREANLQKIQSARRALRPNQPQTYRQAIDLAKQVPPGQPAADLAKELINSWSQEILQMAQIRATAGDLDGAIAAANLVPQDTLAHPAAQTAIQNWQKRKG